LSAFVYNFILLSLTFHCRAERERTLVAVEAEKQTYIDDLQKCESEMMRLKSFVDQFHQQRKHTLSAFDAEKHSFAEELHRLQHEAKAVQDDLKDQCAQQTVAWTQERSELHQKLADGGLKLSSLKEELIRLTASFAEKDSQISAFEATLAEVRDEKRQVQQQLEVSKEEVRKLQHDVTQASDDLRYAEDNLQHTVGTLTHDLQQELASARADVARLETQLDAAKTSEEVAEGMRAQAVASQEQSARENGAIIEKLQSSLGRLSFQAQQAQSFQAIAEESQAQMSSFQQSLAEMRQEKDTIEGQLLRAEAVHAKVTSRAEASEAKCQTLAEAQASLEAELKERDATIAELEKAEEGKEGEHGKSVEVLKQSVDQLMQETAVLKVDLEKLATEKNTLVMEKSKLQCSLNDLHLKNEELQSEVQKLQMSNLRLTEDISSSRTIAGEKLDALNEQIESEKDKVAQAMDKLKQSKADHSAKKKHSIRHVTEEKERLLVSLQRVEQERDQLQHDLVYKVNQEKGATFAKNHLQTELDWVKQDLHNKAQECMQLEAANTHLARSVESLSQEKKEVELLLSDGHKLLEKLRTENHLFETQVRLTTDPMQHPP
jgi:chromosome segregation ATPase